jgi:hypothetical protein
MEALSLISMINNINDSTRERTLIEDDIKEYIKNVMWFHKIYKLDVYSNGFKIAHIIRNINIEIFNSDEKAINIHNLVEIGFTRKIFINSVRRFNIDRRKQQIETIKLINTNIQTLAKFW